MNARALAAPALLFLLANAASAVAADRCTNETLSVRGTPVAARYCVAVLPAMAPGRPVPVQVAETYATSRASFTQNATLQFISGEEASRVLRDVPLERLGMAGTLHVTLVLRGALVRIESAMLTPGAVTIK